MNFKHSLLLHATVLLSFSGCWNSSKKDAAPTQEKTATQTSIPEQSSPQQVSGEDAKLVMQITTEQQFEEAIKNAEKITVVKLDAPWCSACKYLQPHLVDAAKKGAEFNVTRVNVDQLSKIGQQYKIVGIPTLLFFKDGKEIADSRLVGPDATTGDDLLAMMRSAVKKAAI